MEQLYQASIQLSKFSEYAEAKYCQEENHYNFSAGACSLSDPDMNYVIITGGENRESKASVFGEAGYIKDLSDLNQKRWYHACTSYLTNENRVRVKIKIVLCSLFFFQ